MRRPNRHTFAASCRERVASSLCSPECKRARRPGGGFALSPSSLPLDRARRLGRNIVNDAVDAFDFVNDAVGDAGE